MPNEPAALPQPQHQRVYCSITKVPQHCPWYEIIIGKECAMRRSSNAKPKSTINQIEINVTA